MGSAADAALVVFSGVSGEAVVSVGCAAEVAGVSAGTTSFGAAVVSTVGCALDVVSAAIAVVTQNRQRQMIQCFMVGSLTVERGPVLQIASVHRLPDDKN